VSKGLSSFVAMEGGVVPAAGTADLFSLKSDAPIAGDPSGLSAGEKAAAVEALSAKVVLGVRDERRKHLQRTSFWIPEVAPKAAATDIPKPDPAPRDPGSGEFLRLKQLIPVKFAIRPLDETETMDGAGTITTSLAGVTVMAKDSPFFCPCCTKSFQFQKVSLLKKCGHVFCESCTKKFIVPSERCYTCESKCYVDKEIISLQQGESGFAGHNEVEVKVCRPGMVV